FEKMFKWLLLAYEWSLTAVLRHRAPMGLVFFLVLLATIEMFRVVPKGFIPDQDNDSLNINIQAAQGTSYYELLDHLRQIAATVNRNPYVDTFFASTGGGFGAMNSGRVNIQLTPRAKRPLSAAQIAQQLRSSLQGFPGFRAFVTLPPALQIGGRMS